MAVCLLNGCVNNMVHVHERMTSISLNAKTSDCRINMLNGFVFPYFFYEVENEFKMKNHVFVSRVIFQCKKLVIDEKLKRDSNVLAPTIQTQFNGNT